MQKLVNDKDAEVATLKRNLEQLSELLRRRKKQEEGSDDRIAELERYLKEVMERNSELTENLNATVDKCQSLENAIAESDMRAKTAHARAEEIRADASEKMRLHDDLEILRS